MQTIKIISIGKVMQPEQIKQPIEEAQQINNPPAPQISKITKKPTDNRSLIRLAITIASILIVATAGYLTYSYFESSDTDTPPNQSVKNDDINTIKPEISPAVKDTVNILTNSLTEESTIIENDDSVILTEASDEAGIIGDSINENELE
jgi:hypothetical protein